MEYILRVGLGVERSSFLTDVSEKLEFTDSVKNSNIYCQYIVYTTYNVDFEYYQGKRSSRG